MEERVLDIETKLAFQENTIRELSDIVFEQQKKIDFLEEKMNIMIGRLKNLNESINVVDEKPPHY